MKTILVPTDFSAVAQNAIDYAVEMAKVSKAKLILFHVYHVPVVPSEIPVALPMDEVEKESMKKLKKIAKKIQSGQGKKVAVECKCQLGFAVEEINSFAEANKTELIIMGTEGTGYLKEKLMGNITTSLIKKAKCPVLAIDRNVKFRNVKKIALAFDYSSMDYASVLAPLMKIVKLFSSHVYVLNVLPEPKAILAIDKAVEGIKLDHLLDKAEHSFHYSENDDVVDGVNDFVKAKKIDMVVMIPKSTSVMKSFFHSSNTKRLAFHTDVPLLALHE